MSTKRGGHNCNRAAASVKEPLPMDLLLEIVAHCDLTTIIRCTRVSKSLRGAILEQAFRRRLVVKAAAGGGGFDPANLFGVSYLPCGAHYAIPTPSPIQLHTGVVTSSLREHRFEPVASRDRLLLFRRYRSPPNVELRVWDTTTNHVTSLPSAAMFYAHAFLSVSDADADAGGSFELIVTDKQIRFQTFSSKHGQWDAVHETSVKRNTDRLECLLPRRLLPNRLDASSRVIGRTVYWLCHRSTWGDCWDGILALDVDAAEATTLELPAGCLSRMMHRNKDKHLLLASVRGRLSLLVAESAGISMWTLAPASSLQPAVTWSRQLVMAAEEIMRQVGLVSSPLSYVLEGFGERSGAVVIRVGRRDLLRLDLGSKVLSRIHHPGDEPVACLFLHETDLASLLKKSF